MHVDMVALDSGDNARTEVFRSPSNRAFEGVRCRMRGLSRLPPQDLVGFVVDHPLSERRDGWKGTAFCLVPGRACEWPPKMRFFEAFPWIQTRPGRRRN